MVHASPPVYLHFFVHALQPSLLSSTFSVPGIRPGSTSGRNNHHQNHRKTRSNSLTKSFTFLPSFTSFRHSSFLASINLTKQRKPSGFFKVFFFFFFFLLNFSSPPPSPSPLENVSGSSLGANPLSLEPTGSEHGLSPQRISIFFICEIART